LLRSSKKLISKGQFAYDIAEQIANGAGFKCPEYIENGLTWVVGASE
jgi:putative ATP-dependent endonuclease of OLD family